MMPNGYSGLTRSNHRQAGTSDYGYTAEDMVPLRKAAALDYHRMGSKIYCLGSDGSKGEYASKEMIQAHEGLFGMESQMWERIKGSGSGLCR